MPDNYVYHPPPGPAAEPARAPAPNLRIIDFPLWFWCLLSCITVLCFPCVFVKVMVDERARRETSRETSPAEDDSCSTCRALDLNMHCWEDDCGMTALHYLALGRRQTPYEKMSFNFPAVGEHAIRGLAGSESIEQRKNLLLLLLRHGRLSPLHLSVKNSHGATALHAAACVGDVVLIETMIRKADDSYRQPTFDDNTVDTALATPDGIGDWQRQAVLIGAGNDGAAAQLPVDVAASHGHFAAARLLGLGLLTNIDQVRSLCATLISDCGLGVSRGQLLPTAGVVREDSDAVASSWALTSQGVLGAAAEAPPAVEVLQDDSARLEHLRLKERQLAAQLGMPTAKAGAMLAQHHFDLKLALDAHRASMEVSTRQGGEEIGENAEIVHTTHDEVRLRVRDDAGAPGDEECPVCFERADVRASVCRRALRECGHFVCDRCLFGHVRVRIMDEGDLSLLVCPAEGCRETIASESVEEVLREDADALGRYRQLLSHATVTQNSSVSWCPAADCDASLELPAHAHSKSVGVACACGTSFCFSCKASPPHEPASCSAWEHFKGEYESEAHQQERGNQEWIRRRTTACAGCSCAVERSEGCNHMRCTQCQHEFCFACGAAWTNEHYSCARPENPDERVGGVTAHDARKLLDWCLEGYELWEGKRVATPKDYWASLARSVEPARDEERSRYWVDLTQALSTVTTAQKDLEFACLIMSRSFAVDCAIPEGFDYIRARRLLRTLRASLEVTLQALSRLLIPPGQESSRDGPDLSYPLAFLYILQTEADMERGILRLCRRVRGRAQRLVAAGRAGVLLSPSSKTSTATFLVAEALDHVKTRVHGLLGW